MRKLTVLAVVAVFGSAAVRADDKLFNSKDLTGWRIFVDPKAKDADPKATWKISEGMIVCSGKPAGYIITEKDYDNYVLKLKWRWAAGSKGGNSGVLLHCTGADKVWPKSVEAQLMHGRAGDFWLIDNPKLEVDMERQDKKSPRHFFRIGDNVEKAIGEWNEYVITCKGDSITLVVNGKDVNSGKKSELTKGKIALQSEGAEIHFKDITIGPAK